MRLHCLTAYYQAPVGEIEVRIFYTYRAGTPGRFSGPPEHCYPAEAAEMEAYRVERVDGIALTPEIVAWAEEHLAEDGYDAAVERAETDLQPDPDAARRDDAS